MSCVWISSIKPSAKASSALVYSVFLFSLSAKIWIFLQKRKNIMGCLGAVEIHHTDPEREKDRQTFLGGLFALSSRHRLNGT